MVARMDPAPFYVYVGEAIRKRRQEVKLSQKSLAEAAGLKRASISNIERGRQKLLLHTFFQIVNELDTLPQNLLPSDKATGIGVPVNLRYPKVKESIESIEAELRKTRKGSKEGKP